MRKLLVTGLSVALLVGATGADASMRSAATNFANETAVDRFDDGTGQYGFLWCERYDDEEGPLLACGVLWRGSFDGSSALCGGYVLAEPISRRRFQADFPEEEGMMCLSGYSSEGDSPVTWVPGTSP